MGGAARVANMTRWEGRGVEPCPPDVSAGRHPPQDLQPGFNRTGGPAYLNNGQRGITLGMA